MIGRRFFKLSSLADPTQFLSLGFLFMALLVCTDGQAMYKVVGPDGQISYTDRPPVPTVDKVVPLPPLTSSGIGTPLANLPIAVRDAANRYPVVLYTALDCTACDKGRTLLMQRGIPFAERQIISAKDNESFQKKTGGRETPVLMIGTQVSRGYDPDLWGQYLSAAGYPITSQLPRSFVFSLPQPLTDPPELSSDKTKPTVTTAKPPPPPSSPSGIQF